VIEQLYLHQDCMACLLGKMNRLPRSLGSGIPPNPFTVVSVDYKSINPTAIGGYTGFYLYIERTFTYKIAILLKQAPNAEIFIDATRRVHAIFKAQGHTLHILRPDAGTVEATASAIDTLRADLLLTVEPAAPECQFQNDCERSMQTVLKGVASIFVTAVFLSHHFWSLALLAFLNASNCTPNTQSGDYSPEYHLTGRHPDISKRFKFAFGQPVASVVLKQDSVERKRTFTFAPYADFGYAVGSVPHTGATLVYYPRVNKQCVQLRQDVKAVKLLDTPARSSDATKALQPCDNPDGSTTFPAFVPVPTLDITPGESTIESFDQDIPVDTYTFGDMSSSEPSLWPAPIPRPSASKGISAPSSEGATDVRIAPDPEDVPAAKRPKRDHRPPANLDDYVTSISSSSSRSTVKLASTVPSPPADPPDTTPDISPSELDPWSLDDYIDITHCELPSTYQVSAASSSSSTAPDPDNPTLAAAQNSTEWRTLWQPACQDEMDNLEEHDVGDEVLYEDIPKGAVIYPTKMCLKKKRHIH
jgi:hypothetical protein